MIKLLCFNKRQFSTKEFEVTPTIFPDGTSQVWKLPEEMLNQSEYKIVWNFEAERELIDICSLSRLLPTNAFIHLHIPYLPYARQDKNYDNNSTFNLNVFANILNSNGFSKITSVDVHNVERTQEIIERFENIEVTNIQQNLIENFKPNLIVFPDKGARERYSSKLNTLGVLHCEKIRDQLTGVIIHLELNGQIRGKCDKRYLILDDICDRGRTFVETAKAIRKQDKCAYIGLFVTHGIFSKGRNLEGIDEIFTTNSLLKNATAHYKV